MTVNWSQLRPWNGSQQSAFEEICCQLAHAESSPAGSKFLRKGTQDAGVECYWQLLGGDEWGWQAKFFPTPPGDPQWAQIDESVKTALEKHPRLTSYTVCLPIDRSDPRLANHQHFMDKWNAHTEKWRGWAGDRQMSVEFRYWGSHEIWMRLAHDDHRGRYFFWFNKDFLSPGWFRDRVQEAIAMAGARYTPELNVELPIVQVFEGLGRTEAFFRRIAECYGELKKRYRSCLPHKPFKQLAHNFNLLDSSIGQLFSYLDYIKRSVDEPIAFDSLLRWTSQTNDVVMELVDEIQKLPETPQNKVLGEESAQESQRERQVLRNLRHHFYELTRALNELAALSRSPEARLSNVPALLLVGNAGTGKTHLLCDLAEQRAQAGLPTLLLMGECFRDAEPWSQITERLGLTCDRDSFLGALDAAAEASGSRALILIDALNEGAGKDIWNRELPGFLLAVSRFARLGVAVSVRTSYEPVAIREGLVPQRLVRVTHYGFAEHEYQATRTFFAHYGIQQPNVPLLAPEFQNPLFLKLFCKALQNKGITSIPRGLRGIKELFDFFLESVNEKLARHEHLDFDPRDRLVQRAVEGLAALLAERKSTWVDRDQAKSIVNSLLPRADFSDSLFRRLLDEGVLHEERLEAGHRHAQEVVYFGYERFTDHIVVSGLLDRHLSASDPASSFAPANPLGELVGDESACWRNRGLVDALSIQIPERLGKELTEIAPACVGFRAVREAFVQSLIWRNPRTINQATLNYINEHVIRYRGTHDQFLEALLTIAGDPDHPYNARFLHKQLVRLPMAERDSWWSIFIHEHYGEHGAVDRLVDWAWSDQPKDQISDEAMLLTGVTLAWFCTSSNRYLRDRATKAVVHLLTPRIRIVRDALHAFVGVNDPYLLERVVAVAYGCAMRSTDLTAITELAQEVYDWFFANGEPPPHLLLRDYARGIIDLALHHGLALKVEETKIRPPYKSEWPPTIPSEQEISEKYKRDAKGLSEQEFGLWSIYHSVMGLGDFGRYIIGTNHGFFSWSSRHLSEPRIPTQKQEYDSFVSTLTTRQKKALQRFHDVRSGMRLLEARFFGTATSRVPKSKATVKKQLQSARRALEKALGKKKWRQFKQRALPYIERPDSNERRDDFDLSIAQRWILQKVLDLGWTPERFGWFDRSMDRAWGLGRGEKKAERIGKKYQWIAYHEFLARVSDNFQFKEERWSSEASGEYEGPWQFYRRDIDPSMVLRSTAESRSDAWWVSRCDDWQPELRSAEWLQNQADLPDLRQLIAVTNPRDGSRWLSLGGFYEWEEPTPADEEKYEVERRQLWYMLKCYVVRRDELDSLFEWGKKQNFWGRWMPESKELIDVFLGEYFWAPAFKTQNIPYHGHPGWTKGWDKKLPAPVHDASDIYHGESTGYDCSVEDSINIMLPCDWIAEEMKLCWKGQEGCHFDKNGSLIAFDPSVREQGPGVILVNRDALLAFLSDQGFDLMWTVIGAKQLIGGRSGPDRWPGELEMNGVFRLAGSRVDGEIRSVFRSK